MEPAARRRADRLPRELDVVLVAPGQRRDDGAADLARDLQHAPVVTLGRRREAGLHDVHAERVELPGESKLLLGRETVAGSLLAVAQGRVEDQNVGECHTVSSSSKRVKRKAPRSFRSAAPVHSVETVLLSHVARVGTPRSPCSPRMVSRRLRTTMTSARLKSMGSGSLGAAFGNTGGRAR